MFKARTSFILLFEKVVGFDVFSFLGISLFVSDMVS